MKNILKFLQFVFILFVAADAFAQVSYEDVVYLKNGSIIYGIIVEQIPNESLKIQTKDKKIFDFKMDEVEKITKEKTHAQEKPAEKPEPDNSGSSENYSSYSFGLETHFGPGIGTNNSNQMTFATNIINGVLIKNFFSIGAGIGFEFLSDHENNTYYYSNGYNKDYTHQYLMIAYYIDIRLMPVKGNITPLVILNYGYSGDLFSTAINGGALVNVGLGAKFYVTRKLGLNLSLNYKNQQLHYNQNYFDHNLNNTPNKSLSTSLQYMCISFGVSF